MSLVHDSAEEVPTEGEGCRDRQFQDIRTSRESETTRNKMAQPTNLIGLTRQRLTTKPHRSKRQDNSAVQRDNAHSINDATEQEHDAVPKGSKVPMFGGEERYLSARMAPLNRSMLGVMLRTNHAHVNGASVQHINSGIFQILVCAAAHITHHTIMKLTVHVISMVSMLLPLRSLYPEL